MIQINAESYVDICTAISLRVKLRRLELNLTQMGLAKRAGVNIETYRKFERTTEISLSNLLKIAIAINMTSDFEALFAQQQYQSLNELLQSDNIRRKRGKRT